MRISLVWAMAENHVIGREGKLPWHLPDDLRHFKALTSGHVVIMGRKTCDSIDRRPLPDRRCIVVTRDQTFEADGFQVAHGFDEGLALANEAPHVFVLGGAEIFRLALPRADRLFVTLIHDEVEGDVCFPEMEWDEWRLLEDHFHEADERHEHTFSMRSYERAQPAPERACR